MIKERYRNIEDELYVVTVLNAIQDNLDEFLSLLRAPKKISDLGKPTADEIKKLIESIKRIQNMAMKQNAFGNNSESAAEHIFQFSQMMEMFLNPLYLAWQVYEYGWHSDFWKEGESMFGFMMFEVRAEEIINQLINVLETQSPFSLLERDGAITKGLLKVYRHFLTQNWKSKV